MDEGAIVICNLSKGALGESTAHLLGALLTTTIAQAALSCADMSRLLYNGLPSSPTRLKLFADPPPRRTSAHRLIEMSHLRFGRPRIKVEDRVRGFLSA